MSNDENPYEVLNVDAAPLNSAALPPTWYKVEGDLLVCGKTVILPKLCVFTGSTEDLVATSTQAQYPSFRLVIVQRVCRIAYYTSRAEYSRRRLMSALTIGWIVCSILLIFVGTATDSGYIIVLGIALTLFAFFVRLAIALVHGLNLRVVDFDPPGVFKIRGFPMTFLNLLAQQNSSSKDH